jgi:hypothetical protein
MFCAAMPIFASFLLCLIELPLTQASGTGNDTISVRTVLCDPISTLIVDIALLVIISLMANLLPRRGTWPTAASST